ncbi:MAG: LysM peptidoglycan-binding domain-containing protein [Anaerolinea sp.]|nr:LysM peptidoglycan-binding domain-containing protein [Anaerolinea sp.]
MQQKSSSSLFYVILAGLLLIIVLAGGGLLLLRNRERATAVPDPTATPLVIFVTATPESAPLPVTNTPPIEEGLATAVPPASSPAIATVTLAPSATFVLITPTPTIHTVQWGETLTQIAQRYDVTVAAILQANNISNPDLIQPGQQLVIPPP